MNEVTQELVNEFKLRMKLSDDEDDNLKRILEASVEDITNKCGIFDINVNKSFKELVMERSRYVYNDALEYFDENFVSQLTVLAISYANTEVPNSLVTYQDVVNALGYTPANVNELNAFIARYNQEQATLNARVTNNTNRIATLEASGGGNGQTVDLTPINNRLTIVENVNNTQNQRITDLENNNTQTDLTPITNRLTAIEGVNNNQDTRINSNAERIQILENANPSNGGNQDLTPINNRLTSLESDVTTLQNASTSTNDRVTALENASTNDLGPLTTRVTNVENEVNQLETTVTNNNNSLNNRVAILENGGGTGGQDLTDLNNRVTDLEARPIVDVTPINQRISNVETVNNAQNTNITSNTNRIVALENSQGQNVDLTPLENRVTNLESRPIIDLQPLTSRVTTNESNIINLEGRLTTQENRTNTIIRQDNTTPLRTEVVSSLPTSNLNAGRIVFDTSDNTFRGYNGGAWL